MQKCYATVHDATTGVSMCLHHLNLFVSSLIREVVRVAPVRQTLRTARGRHDPTSPPLVLQPRSSTALLNSPVCFPQFPLQVRNTGTGHGSVSPSTLVKKVWNLDVADRDLTRQNDPGINTWNALHSYPAKAESGRINYGLLLLS